MSTWREGIRARLQAVRDDLQHNEGAPPLDAKTTTVFVATAVLLTLFYYYGKSGFYRRELAALFEARWGASLGEYVDLMPYVWWAGNAVVMRVLVPVLLIVLVFRESPRDYGLRLRGVLPHLPIYVALYVGMLPLLVWAAGTPAFQSTYPFYSRAAQGGGHFWWYELTYFLQFVGVEFFFRGFLTFALFRRFGYHALMIMAIPYVMIHFNKPIPETIGALFAGLLLGYLALKAKSIWPGVALHWGIAVTMDLLAIAHQQGGVAPALRAIF